MLPVEFESGLSASYTALQNLVDTYGAWRACLAWQAELVEIPPVTAGLVPGSRRCHVHAKDGG